MNHSGKLTKVLFVSHSSGLNGAEKSLLLLLKNIDRNHFEPLVVLPGPGPLKDEIKRLGIRTYEVKSPWWATGRKNFLRIILQFGYCIVSKAIALPKFYKIIKQEQIDVIYTNTIVIFSGAISALIARIPHIWHIREIIPGNPNLHFFLPHKPLFRLISRMSNVIIANSNATAAQFRADKSKENIKVIYNAVDSNEFRPSASCPNIGDLSSEDWIVAVVGSLQKRKAQDDAIRAIKIVEKKIPNIRLLLIGEGSEGFTNYLKQIVSNLNLDGKVIFTGYRYDVPQILLYCKVLLVPSWDEPFGRAAIEAMAAGIPVIGANAGGTREIIKDGLTGYLVPPKDPLKIAQAIIELYHHPKLIKKFGDYGRRLVGEKFAPQPHAHAIEDIILGVVNNCGKVED